MINAQETKRLLKDFAWECYEFWANELETDDDKDVWHRVIVDLEGCKHNPFTTKGDVLDVEAKAEFIKNLKLDLGI